MAQDLFLKTFRDVIDHLVRWGGGLLSAAQEATAREAVVTGYRKTFFDHPWRYFKDDRRINLDEDYTTGTIAYDFTGGLFQRMVTLTGGTWPDWAAYGRILLGSDTVIYKVSQRKTDSIITLDTTHSPREDIDAADETTFILFRSEYPLTNIHRFGPISDESGFWGNHYVTPSEWLRRQRLWRSSGRPFYWTVMGGRDFYGNMGLRLSSYADSPQTLDFIGTVKPRRLFIDGYADAWTAGTVTSAENTTVVITGNTFTDEVVGAMLRLSRNANVPTDVEGGNPYIEQRVIAAVSGSTLTLDDAIDTDGVTISTGYCISDPIDLPEQLYDLFLAWSEYEYARMVAKERLKEAGIELNGKLGARNMARAWDKQVNEPVIGFPWAHPGWLLMNSQLTSTTAYDGDPL